MKTRYKIGFSVFAIVFVALVLAASINVYIVRAPSGGVIFSKGDEAYLFLADTQLGYKFSYLRYLGEIIGQSMALPTEWTDSQTGTLVIRLTRSDAAQSKIKFTGGNTNAPMRVTPFDDGIYAMCPGAKLCKLNGNEFLPATANEEQSHNGLMLEGTDNQSVNGWLVRSLNDVPGKRFEIALGNHRILAAENRSTTRGKYSSYLISISEPGRPPQTIYHVDGDFRRVSEAEYKQLFGSR